MLLYVKETWALSSNRNHSWSLVSVKVDGSDTRSQGRVPPYTTRTSRNQEGGRKKIYNLYLVSQKNLTFILPWVLVLIDEFLCLLHKSVKISCRYLY